MSKKKSIYLLILLPAIAIAQVSPPSEERPAPQGPQVQGMQGESSRELNAAPPTAFPVKPLSPPPPMTQTTPKTENGVTYLCGGIGSEEAKQIKQDARNYDLMLTFAARAGNYLADVNIDIADRKGQSVLKVNCGGPMMLVNLPGKGTYAIRAEKNSYTVTRTVQLQGKRPAKAVTMIWPNAASGMEDSFSGH